MQQSSGRTALPVYAEKEEEKDMDESQRGIPRGPFDGNAFDNPLITYERYTIPFSHSANQWSGPDGVSQGGYFEDGNDLNTLSRQWLERDSNGLLQGSHDYGTIQYATARISNAPTPSSDGSSTVLSKPSNQTYRSPSASTYQTNTSMTPRELPFSKELPVSTTADYLDIYSTSGFAPAPNVQTLAASPDYVNIEHPLIPTSIVDCAYLPLQVPTGYPSYSLAGIYDQSLRLVDDMDPVQSVTYPLSNTASLEQLVTEPHSQTQRSFKEYEFTIEELKEIGKQTKRKTEKVPRPRKKVTESRALMAIPKTEPISRHTSCWRCRRYKKPCNGKGSVCDACVTSGFRIWSSDIGCRKGDMKDFILMLIPTDVERNPIKVVDAYTKPPSFRQSAAIYPSGTLIPASARKGDAWNQFLYKVQSTGIHGPGVLELLQVVIRHQRKLKKPDKVIVTAVRAMSAAADIFRLLVATKGSATLVDTLNLTEIFSEIRKVMAIAAGQFLRNCLTGRIKSWFTTFMAANINVFAYILTGDAIAAIPPKYRAQVWPDVRKTLLELRQMLYPTARDLLNALAKGSRPLDMSCWQMSRGYEGSPRSPETWIRNREGMRLVDDCEATFDAMRELQEWREQFSSLMSGDTWMASQPLVVDLLMISAVSRMFITPKG